MKIDIIKNKKHIKRRKNGKKTVPRTSFAEPLVVMILLAILIIIFTPYAYGIIPFVIYLPLLLIPALLVMGFLSYPLGKKIREYVITNKKSDSYGVLLVLGYMMLLFVICTALILLRGPQCVFSFGTHKCEEIPFVTMIGACLASIFIILLPAWINVTGIDSNSNGKGKTKKSSSKKNQDDFEEL